MKKWFLSLLFVAGVIGFANAATTIVSSVIAGAGLSFSGAILSCAIFSGSAIGCVPSSGGGTTNFLRADGAWAAPSANFTTVSKTTTYTVQTADSGIWFDNSGATASVTLTLPTAAAGLNYCGMAVAAQTLEFLASGTDTITDDGFTGISAGNIQSNAAGGLICLYARGAGGWYVTRAVGSWSLT